MKMSGLLRRQFALSRYLQRSRLCLVRSGQFSLVRLAGRRPVLSIKYRPFMPFLPW